MQKAGSITKKLKIKALSAIEVILALALFSAVVLGISGTISYGLQATAFAYTHNQATFLAVEGLAALSNLRNVDFASLAAGSYGLGLNNNLWLLVPNSDQTGGFTRIITISDLDNNTKLVTTTVSWNNPQPGGSISLEKRLTNWQRIVNLEPSWQNLTASAILDIPGNQKARKVKISGNYAFLIHDTPSQNFAVVDISNLNTPTLVTTLTLSGTPRDLALSNNFAYISSTDNANELQIVNIANPLVPVFAGGYNAGGNFDSTGIYAAGSTVYLLRRQSNQPELYIIDVTNPAATILTGSLQLSSTANDLYVSSNLAYLASTDNNTEFKVLDLSNPALPVEIGNLNGAGNADSLSIIISGTRAYLGRENGEFSIINISSPNSPSIISTFDAQAAINDLAMDRDNNFVFLATSLTANELQLVNITSETSLALYAASNADDDLIGLDYNSLNNYLIAVGVSNSQEFTIYEPAP